MNANESVEYWKKKYQSVTGSNRDYFIAIHPGMPDWINRFYHRQKLVSFKKLLSFCSPIKGLKVLDVGCGTGKFSILFSKRGATVTAIDLSQKLLERNRRLMPGIYFTVMSAEKLDIPDESIDIVNSMMVLQHIPYENRKNAIVEICRVLKPGGKLMIVESIYKKDSSNVVFPMTKNEWIDSFQKHGMKLVHFHGMEYVVLRRMWSSILGTIVRIIRGRPVTKVNKQEMEHRNIIQLDTKNETGIARRTVKTMLGVIDFLIIYASYPLEPISKLLLTGETAIRGAFLFQKDT